MELYRSPYVFHSINFFEVGALFCLVLDQNQRYFWNPLIKLHRMVTELGWSEQLGAIVTSLVDTPAAGVEFLNVGGNVGGKISPCKIKGDNSFSPHDSPHGFPQGGKM